MELDEAPSCVQLSGLTRFVEGESGGGSGCGGIVKSESLGFFLYSRNASGIILEITIKKVDYGKT